MLQECLVSDYQRKFFYGELKRYKYTHKASLKDFDISTDSRKQSVYDRVQWRSLIRKRVAQYEAKKVCEA